MNDLLYLQETYPWLFPTLLVLFVWEAVWKLIAMWKAGRNNHLVWFICIAFISTLGVLPIAYILIHKKKPTK